MEVLITGGAGYIGSHVALSLLDLGYKVTVIDDLSTGNENLIPAKSEFVNCNINESEKIENLIMKKKFDGIMHFAGFVKVEESVEYPKKYFENNTENSKILFDICIKNNLSNIIFSSTAAIYGNNNQQTLISENGKINPLNPYGESASAHTLIYVKGQWLVLKGLHGNARRTYNMTPEQALEYQREIFLAMEKDTIFAWWNFARIYHCVNTFRN